MPHQVKLENLTDMKERSTEIALGVVRNDESLIKLFRTVTLAPCTM